jgi:hypothetical protein
MMAHSASSLAPGLRLHIQLALCHRFEQSREVRFFCRANLSCRALITQEPRSQQSLLGWLPAPASALAQLPAPASALAHCMLLQRACPSPAADSPVAAAVVAAAPVRCAACVAAALAAARRNHSVPVARLATHIPQVFPDWFAVRSADAQHSTAVL